MPCKLYENLDRPQRDPHARLRLRERRRQPAAIPDACVAVGDAELSERAADRRDDHVVDRAAGVLADRLELPRSVDDDDGPFVWSTTAERVVSERRSREPTRVRADDPYATHAPCRHRAMFPLD